MDPTATNRHREIAQLEQELLEKSKRLAELKRSLPREPVKEYVLAGWEGPTTLSALFGAKRDLVVVHNMGKGCRYCTLWADGFQGVWRHLADRAGFVVCSPDSVETQKAFAASRGWGFPMVSGRGSTFIEDMGFRGETSWMPGVSTFRMQPDGAVERVARAEFGPFDPFCGVWHLIALLEEGVRGWEPRYSYEA